MDREQRSLLLADGSASHLFFMGTMLRRLEYTVQTVTTAEDALRAMNAALPSLLVTNTVLPSMNGINLLKHMKQDARLKNVPVIIHTSENDPAVRTACLAAGCADFFTKPTDFDVLYRAIQSATESAPRKNIRIDTLLDVEIKDKAGAGRTEQVTTLSEGGLYIRSKTPEPVHTVLSLTIFFIDRKIRAQASVQYSSTVIGGQHKEPGMGLTFTSIDDGDRRYVREFIKEQVAKGFSL